MDALLDYACRFLASVFPSQVEPIAAALDDSIQPGPLEEGRRDAAQRAADIRARLAELYIERGGVKRDDLAATYEAAKSLLGDIWDVVMTDAQGLTRAAPAAAKWADTVVARAVVRGAPQDLTEVASG